MALFFTVKHVHIINTMWKRKAVTNYVENVISSVCVCLRTTYFLGGFHVPSNHINLEYLSGGEV